MLTLSNADKLRNQQVIEATYPMFSEQLKEVFNQQLAECRNYYEYQDWLERVQLTAKFFGERQPT